MSWIEGKQESRRKFKDINKEIAETRGYLNENEAKILLYKFLYDNVSYASNLLMGIKLFPFQHITIKAMMESDYVLGVMARGASKCSGENEPVWTHNGIKKAINVEVGDYVQSKVGMNLVEKKIINEKQQTFEIKTTLGYSNEGLDHHKLLKLNPKTLEIDWEFSKNLKVGDFISMRRNMEMPEQLDIFEGFKPSLSEDQNRKNFNIRAASLEEWYYFFGLVIGGENTIKSPLSIEISSEDPEVVEFLCKFSEKIGAESKIDLMSDFLVKKVVLRSSPLVENLMMNHLGFTAAPTREKTIPQSLMQCDESCTSSMIRGMFDIGGECFLKIAEEKSPVISVGFASPSYEMLRQVRNLLLQIGIISSTEVCSGSAKKIIVDEWGDISTFRKKIGFKTKKNQQKLNLINESLDSSDIIPFVGDYLEKKYAKKAFLSYNDDGKVVELKFQKNISKNLLKNIINFGELDEEDSKKLSELLDQNLFFDSVKKITKKSGVTVDLQVAKEHNYISDGIISHNSFSTAVFAGLHALFNQGTQIGIVSKTFRQSKMIFKKLEDIMEKPEAQLFKSCCGKVSRGSDEWSLSIGASSIRALPLGDGEKLRGYRFHCVIIDEFLLMPEKTFNEVILPFLAVVDNPTDRSELDELENQLILEGQMNPEDKYRWKNNKLITLSSASYKFEYMYEVYQKYEALITGDLSSLDDRVRNAMKSQVSTGDSSLEDSDTAHRTIVHLSYDALPKALYDKDLVKQSLATMSQAQFEREFGAMFTEDSSGFFKISNLKKCTELDGSNDHIRIQGDPTKEYLVSFDPSWSEDDGSDDWALQVFEIDRLSGKNILVHSYALPGQKMKTHIQYFHYILTNFNISVVFGDAAGGTQFIRACNESKLFKDDNIELETIETSKLNNPSTYAEGLRELKNQYNKNSRRFVYLCKFNADWIRVSNEMLQADIDRNKIRFAGLPMDSDWKSEVAKIIPINDLTFKKKSNMKDFDSDIDTYENGLIGDNAKKVDFIEHVKNMIDLTKSQAAAIELTTSATGTHRFDLPPTLRKQSGANKTRRDSYTALFIGNWGCRVFRDMENPNVKQYSDFTPKFIR